MALQLKLFVFIIELKSSFHVTIESSETVSGLKGRIWEKRKNDLKGVDTYQLTLYKVELPDDRTLGQSAAQAVKAKEPLSPSRLLSRGSPSGDDDQHRHRS